MKPTCPHRFTHLQISILASGLITYHYCSTACAELNSTRAVVHDGVVKGREIKMSDYEQFVLKILKVFVK